MAKYDKTFNIQHIQHKIADPPVFLAGPMPDFPWPSVISLVLAWISSWRQRSKSSPPKQGDTLFPVLDSRINMLKKAIQIDYVMQNIDINLEIH